MSTGRAQLWTPDLGGRRGALIDWTTQRWVQLTGRAIAVAEHPWLQGPVGDVHIIGPDFFSRLAARDGLVVAPFSSCGLVPSFSALDAPDCRIARIDPRVVEFYEQTAQFGLDVWSAWSGVFRPFGRALALIFSRRLQQLNVPLSPLETSAGLHSEVLRIGSRDQTVQYTAWVRATVSTGQTLYAGAYSICRVPGHPAPCVKVVFPLPNGSATVFMKAKAEAEGTLVLRSSGRTFGDPGFYFYVESEPGRGWARYVRTMRETIRVFVDSRPELRATHELEIWRTIFVRLHYRMRQRDKTS